MPSKNIYVKDSALAFVEEVEKMLPEGESLSSLFLDCVRQRKEALEQGAQEKSSVKNVQKIKVKVGEPPITKVFEGRWLFGNDYEGMQPDNEDGSGITYLGTYAAAQTKQGRIVILHHADNSTGMEVYDTFNEFKDDTFDRGYPSYPDNIIAAVAEALNVSFEVEMDI